MREISRMFPEVTFVLYGEGDESNDIWYKYFKDGKMQHCPVILAFDAFDEDKFSILFLLTFKPFDNDIFTR
jgi:hypothetical protein